MLLLRAHRASSEGALRLASQLLQHAASYSVAPGSQADLASSLHPVGPCPWHSMHNQAEPPGTPSSSSGAPGRALSTSIPMSPLLGQVAASFSGRSHVLPPLLLLRHAAMTPSTSASPSSPSSQTGSAKGAPVTAGMANQQASAQLAEKNDQGAGQGDDVHRAFAH
jgi:hypothetical protein